MTTSDDLVKDLGLSRTAISQIINGKGRYPDETRQRVLARARELGYAPHAGARAARLKRFETLALFNAAPFWQGLLHPGLYEGCMEGCAAAGYRLLLETVTAEGMPGLEQRSNLLGQRMCDGLLMNYHMPPSAELQRLVDICGVPVLWLNVQMESGSIYPDDQDAARQLTRALLAHGRRRIAYVDCGEHRHGIRGGLDGAHYSVAARLGGVRRELDEAGLGLRLLTAGFRPFAEQLAQARALLAGADRPDGLVCYNELDAQLILLAAAELGLQPGREFGIVQFSRDPYVLKRPLATALTPFRTIGNAAVRTLIAAVAGASRKLPSMPVSYTYVLEETL